MGYWPFSSAGSRYRRLYRDTGPGRQGWGAQQALRHGQQGYDTAGLRAERVTGHARCLSIGVCRDTIFCIMAEGRPLCCDTACDTVPNALRYGAGALQHAWQRARHGQRHDRRGP